MGGSIITVEVGLIADFFFELVATFERYGNAGLTW